MMPFGSVVFAKLSALLISLFINVSGSQVSGIIVYGYRVMLLFTVLGDIQ